MDLFQNQVAVQSIQFAVASVVSMFIAQQAYRSLSEHRHFDAFIATLLALLVMTLAFRSCFYLG